MRQNQIVTILQKQVLKQTVERAEGKSKITAIFNKYKDTLDNLIDSSNIESPDYPDSSNWLRLIDKGLYNTLKSKDGSPTFLEEDCLDEDISITSLEPTSKIQDSQVHQCHDVAILGAKNGRAQYGKSQQGEEDGKNKRVREVEKAIGEIK